jgi:hypothetical protein
LFALAGQLPARVPPGAVRAAAVWRLDSAVLAYLMRPPVCVTVRYPGQPRLDEHVGAARVADAVGTELVVVEPGPEQFCHALPAIVDALDYPDGQRRHLLARTPPTKRSSSGGSSSGDPSRARRARPSRAADREGARHQLAPLVLTSDKLAASFGLACVLTCLLGRVWL